MTNDEAIYVLKNTAFLGWSEQAEKVSEAVRMAVEALKRETSGDAISRHDAIDAIRYTFGNDEFSLEDAYHDCKLVFDGITDDDSFQEADTGLILYYANEIIYALQETLEGKDTKEPERKTGRWMPRDYNKRTGCVTTTVYYYPTCSVCGYSGNYSMSFCPNCGAKMEEGEQDG